MRLHLSTRQEVDTSFATCKELYGKAHGAHATPAHGEVIARLAAREVVDDFERFAGRA